MELNEIPHPPQNMRIRGRSPDISDQTMRRLCIVGPRKYTDYGHEICERLISGLAGYPVTIVSGLAFGIDSIAHEIALDVGLQTIAVPGSGLNDDAIYPASHFSLAMKIIECGGCLVSEFPDHFRATKWAFPQRNRIMVGLSHAALIIEAQEKSGTMITARMAVDYNRDLLAVPGSVLNENSVGTNRLLRDGASVIRDSEDLIEAIGLEIDPNKRRQIASAELIGAEKIIYENLHRIDTTEKITNEFVRNKKMTIEEINRAITTLEMNDLITYVDGRICKK